MRPIGVFVAAIGIVAAGLALADDVTQVEAARLVPVSWQNTVQITGNIVAQQNASLAAQRAGEIVAVLYSSGQTVSAGTVLVKLNDAPEQAQLALDEAKQTEALDALARAGKLMMIHGASQAALEQAEADAAEMRAQVAADRAMLAEQSIIAPFAGIVGIRNIAVGDYVTEGQVVATLTQAAPLRVLFSIPQTEAADVRIGDEFQVLAPALATGHVTALSPMVDAASNARAAEGVLNIGAAAFIPGSFATISLSTGTAAPAYAVPITALNDSLLGRYVFVVEPKNGGYVLRIVYVTELGTQGDMAMIGTADLHAGDQVVAIGGFKLTDGAAVKLSP